MKETYVVHLSKNRSFGNRYLEYERYTPKFYLHTYILPIDDVIE